MCTHLAGLALIAGSAVGFAQPAAVEAALAKPILDPNQPLLEVQVYTAGRVKAMPPVRSAEDWQREASRLRAEVLDKVILRGEARRWNEAPTRVEWVGEIDGGPAYRVRKLRYEAIPGMWIPALLYEPRQLTGKTPAILNVNGHEKDGVATPYIQERCINLAKRGMLALNPEWVGRGQLDTPGFVHYRMNQIDLTGSSGLAPFYLSMRRALDILLQHPNADPERVGVTGLSGGAWQTIIISSLDTRVRLANPVAGYSSYVTRSQWPELDLGDSEQTPSDLAAVLDYTHLTAMLAPRAALLTYNAKDSCCFRADYAVSPLLYAARPIYRLFDAEDRLRYHINHDQGHNYGKDNREAFYRLLRDAFYGGSADFPVEDIPSAQEVRTAEQLRVEIPADSRDFHSVALELARDLPKAGSPDRDRLRELLRARTFHVRATKAGSERQSNLNVTSWRLSLNDEWTVPAVEFTPGGASGTTLLFGDEGRARLAGEVNQLTANGQRVVALDPFYFGESKIAKRDFLFAILIAALGERPLGLDASQIVAIARWARTSGPVAVRGIGPRTSLIALAAAAMDDRTIDSVALSGSFGSLGDILTQNLTADKTPELFCFGLFQEFDIPQLKALVAPRPVTLLP
ncbi:MAG: alpha/beta hydrolase family protein [Bryobacteraceae bacterium]